MTTSVEECQLMRTDLMPELQPLPEKDGRLKWASNQTYAAAGRVFICLDDGAVVCLRGG